MARATSGGAGAGAGAGYELSDSDIRRATHTKVWTYSQLLRKTSLAQLLDAKGRCVILYETQGPLVGHWVALLRHPGGIEYFDPYGGIAPDGEARWLSPGKLAALGENTKALSALIRASGLPLSVNPCHYQSKAPGNNECGRHCVSRVHFSSLSEADYNAMIKRSGLSPDAFVLNVSQKLLGK